MFFVVLISTMTIPFTFCYRFLRYGGESFVYTEKNQRKLISDVWNDLISQRENGFGYITLHRSTFNGDHTWKIPVNIRSIMFLKELPSHYSPKHTEIIFSKDYSVLVNERVSEIEDLIFKTISHE